MNRALKISFAALCVLTALLVQTASATAAQRYASPSGTGSATSCVISDPCSLTNALSFANTADADEIILLPGDYEMGSTPVEIVRGMNVHGEGTPSQTRIISSYVYPVYIGHADATISDVEIVHTGSGSAIFAYSGTIDRVAARSSDGTGCYGHASLIRNSLCVSTASNGSGISLNWSGSVHNQVLRNVTAIGAGDSGVGIYISCSGGCTTNFDAKGVIADGDTNDIIASSDGTSSTTVTLDHSNFTSAMSIGLNTTVSATTVNGNQTDEPVFADVGATGFWHQASNSPTIDAGAVDGQSGVLDIDDEARSQGSAPDIGADEIDNVEPQVSISSPANGSTVTTSTPAVEFAVTEAFPGATECSIDGGSWSVCVSGFALSALANGSHALQVRHTDASGNVGTATSTFTVAVPQTPIQQPGSPIVPDAVPPSTTIGKKPKRKTTNRKAKFTFSSNEPGSTFRCKLDKGKWKACASPYSVKVKLGKHTLLVAAVDAAGHEDRTPAKWRWVVARR